MFSKKMLNHLRKPTALVLTFIMSLSALVSGGFNQSVASAATLNQKTEVTSPDYRSDLNEDTVTVTFTNREGKFAKIYSQKQPGDLSAKNNGEKALVAEVVMENGEGSFDFPASEFPYGPITVRIDVHSSTNADSKNIIDTIYPQFYNAVGVDWRAGLDKAPQNPVTAGMNITFQDDFNAMPELTVQGNDMGETGIIGPGEAHSYATRKIDEERGGMFGWAFFADHDGTKYDPFAIKDDEYMKLSTTYWPEGNIPGASDYWNQKVTAGYLSSMGQDGSGFHTTGGHNQYFECRMFTGTNPALWPAFWLLTSNGAIGADNWGGPSDEIDVLEGYLGSPNGYQATGHQWDYNTGKGAGNWNIMETEAFSNINLAMGFHTFAVLVTEKTTYYYCDNIEVFSHETMDVSWDIGSYFIINGGVSDHFGLPQDGADNFGPSSQPFGFTRYGNTAETYVDWVRVWEDDDSTPRFEMTKSTVKAIPNDFVTVNVNRNSGARAASGSYEITFPGEGWQVYDSTVENGEGGLGDFVTVDGVNAAIEYAMGNEVDQLLFKAPSVIAQNSQIIIDILLNDGLPYRPSLYVNLLTEGERGTEVSVSSATYPFRSESGGSSGSWRDYDPAANEEEYFTFVEGGWWNEGWSWMHCPTNHEPVLDFKFTGNAFELYTVDWDNGGVINVTVDGKDAASYNTHASSDETNLAYQWEDPGGEDKPHTVRITSRSADGGSHVRMAEFKYWYHEDASKPKYTIEKTFYEVTREGSIKPGDIIDVIVDRNAATGSTYGQYTVTLPANVFGDNDYHLISADSLNNRPQDTIQIQVPSDENWLGRVDTIEIKAPNGSGFDKTLKISVKSPDPKDAPPITGSNIIKVNSSTYPYVGNNGGDGGSWKDARSTEENYFNFSGANWWKDGWGWMFTQVDSAGANLEITFEGDAVALYVDYHEGGVAYDIYLDGVKQGSYNSKGSTSNLRVFSANDLVAAEHVIKIVATSGGGHLKFAGFDYNYVPSAVPKLVTVDGSTYAPRSSGSWKDVQVGNRFTNINGSWWNGDGAYMYVRWASSFDFNFTGTEVWAYGSKFDGGGLVSFYIDGVYAGEVDTYNAAGWLGIRDQEFIHIDGLLPGAHALTVKLTEVGDRNMCIIDSFKYMSTPKHMAMKFSAPDEVSGTTGEKVAIKVSRNDIAQGYDGYYDVILPAAAEDSTPWAVLTSDLTFSAGGDADKIIEILIPGDEFALYRDVKIQPVMANDQGKASVMTTRVKFGAATPPDIVSLAAPLYRENIKGFTDLTVAAPGGYIYARASYTHAPDAQHPNKHGYTATIGPVALTGQKGIGTLTVNADDIPNGPVMIKVEAFKADGTSCNGYFQFYNEGGEEWNAGLQGYNASIPGKYDPEAALPAFINETQAGLGKPALQTVFADNFTYSNNNDVKAAISRSGIGKTYGGHYPNFKDDRAGFQGPEYGDSKGQEYNPYRAVNNQYLLMIDRKHDVPSGAADWGGITKYMTSPCISSVSEEGHSASLPDYPNWDGWTNGYTEQYLEARIFFGPNPGTWPAFWALSNGPYKDPVTNVFRDNKTGWKGTDELDISEAWMPASTFGVNTHTWDYESYTTDYERIGGKAGGFNSMDIIAKANNGDRNVGDFQMGFHTFGCYITEEYTYYFFDGEFVSKEKTLPLSWRDGNRWMINTGIDAAKSQGFPEGYGFTRYGNESHTYVDWVRIWEAPVQQTPEFDLYYDYLEVQNVSPGGQLTVKVDRINDEAEALSGTYAVDVPNGWTLVSGANFAAGNKQDTLVFSIPANYLNYNANIGITPTVDGEAIGATLYALTRNTDNSFATEIYPVYNKNGGWDVKVELINKAAAEMAGGVLTVGYPDGSTADFAFGSISGNGRQVITIADMPINVNALTNFTFTVNRDDGFKRVIDRALSSLTAVHTNDFDISGNFDLADWDNAMKVHLSGDQYRNAIWYGEDDSSVDQYVQWSDSKLYVAAVVKDDIHMPGKGSFGDLWSNDSIQLSFDQGRAAGYGGEHIRLTGGLTEAGAGGLGLETFLYNGKEVSDFDINFYRDEDAKTTYYLMAFPWAALLADGNPVADRSDIGFTVLVNDLDGAEGRGWISYMYGIANGKNPAQFGDLILTDDETVVVTKEAISISAVTTKKTYNLGEALDTDSIAVKVNYSDGSYEALSASDYTTDFDSSAAGEQNVTINYGGFTATFKVTVLEVDALLPTVLMITSMPERKDAYAPSEPFDDTGLVLTVMFSDSSSRTLNASEYRLAYDFGTGGNKVVTISYTEGGVTVTAILNAYVDGSKPVFADPVSIAIDADNSVAEYLQGEALDLVVVGTYDGLADRILAPSEYTVTGYDADQPGEQTVTVSYKRIALDEVSFNVTVYAEDGIAITQLPAKAEYKVGEALSLAGLTAVIRYEGTDRTKALPVTASMTSGFDSSGTGEKTVTVAYNNFEAFFTVNVFDITSITVFKAPTKVNYYVDDTLDTAGMVVIGVYGGSSIADVQLAANAYTVDTTVLSEASDEKVVTVSYGDLTATFTVTVETRPVAVSIEVSSLPRVNYYVGEAFNTAGMVVKATYDKNPIGSSTNVVTLAASEYDVTCDPFDTEGQMPVTITCKADTSIKTYIYVNVESAPEITGISVTPPTKVRYFIGDELDTTGMVVNAVYDKPLTYGGSNNTVVVTANDINPATFDEAGEIEVTVVYNDFTASFNVTVFDREVLYVDFDYTKAGSAGGDSGSYVPVNEGLWARNYYEYDNYNLSRIDYRTDENGTVYAGEEIGEKPALIVYGRNANERIRFGLTDELKGRSWYDRDGMFLTISFTYFDSSESYNGEAPNGTAEIGTRNVGGMWKYNYPKLGSTVSFELNGDDTWKTLTTTAFIQDADEDGLLFTLELKGNRILPISYVTVSPATEEEIIVARIPIGVEVDAAASKTHFEIGDELTNEDFQVYLVYTDGTKVDLTSKWDWENQKYTVFGFDSSANGTQTLTIVDSRCVEGTVITSMLYTTTIDVTIGTGETDPEDPPVVDPRLKTLKVWYDAEGEHDEGLRFTGYPSSFEMWKLETVEGVTGLRADNNSQWRVSDTSNYSDNVLENAKITLEFYDSGILSEDTDTYIRCSVPGNELYGDSFGKINDIGAGVRTVEYEKNIYLNANVYDWDGNHTGVDFEFYTRGRTILVKSITISWVVPIDFTELNALIAIADAKVESDYTVETWAAFAAALDTAKSVGADAGATQNEVDAAAAALQAAIEALVAAEPPADEALLSVSAEPETKQGDPVEFVLSMRGMNRLLNAAVEFEVDGAKLEGGAVEALNGFIAADTGSGPVAWTDMGGGIFKGKILLMYMENTKEGLTSADGIDIARILFSAKALGNVGLKVTSLTAAGLNENDVPVYLASGIEQAEAATNVVKVYSPYDVNRDDAIDQLDLTAAQYYYQSREGDANWEEASKADVNGDGLVNMADLIDIILNFDD